MSPIYGRLRKEKTIPNPQQLISRSGSKNMASYSVFFDRDVEKDLSKIPKHDARLIMQRVMKLAGNPRPSQSLKLQHSDITYRLRIGNYRVIYQIDDRSKTVTVYHVRHRKDVYRAF